MIPQMQMQDDLVNDFEFEQQPSKTYKMNLEQMTIGGWIDGLEAVKQSVYKILNTERYDYLIYSWNYGSELTNLIGEQIQFVNSKIEQKITDALLQDERIEKVSDFTFYSSKGAVIVEFTVTTSEGTFMAEKVVNI